MAQEIKYIVAAFKSLDALEKDERDVFFYGRSCLKAEIVVDI